MYYISRTLKHRERENVIYTIRIEFIYNRVIFPSGIESLPLSRIFLVIYHQLAGVKERNSMRKLSAVWIEISGNAKESMISTLLFKTGVKVLSSSSSFAQR